MISAVFDFEQAPVRIIERNEAPWFVAVDVCRALEIMNSRDALSSLDEDEKGVANTDTHGGRQEMAVVSESGVYHLIFRSRKAAAKRFRRWVTQEVLPQLRRQGRVELPGCGGSGEPLALGEELSLPAWMDRAQMHVLPRPAAVVAEVAGIYARLARRLDFKPARRCDAGFALVPQWLWRRVLAEWVEGTPTGRAVHRGVLELAAAPQAAPAEESTGEPRG
jgi:hypothetical protein